MTNSSSTFSEVLTRENGCSYVVELHSTNLQYSDLGVTGHWTGFSTRTWYWNVGLE